MVPRDDRSTLWFVSCSALLGGDRLLERVACHRDTEHQRAAPLALLGASVDDELSRAAVGVTHRESDRERRRKFDRIRLRMRLEVLFMKRRERLKVRQELRCERALNAESVEALADSFEDPVERVRHDRQASRFAA
jgi:hypothetical protein